MKTTRPAQAGVTPGGVLAWQADFDAGRYAEAAVRAQAFVGTCPGDARAWHLLGLALSFSGEGPRALECLDTASRLDRNDASVWDALGVARMQAGEHAEAARAFRRGLQLAPGSASIWTNASQNALAGGALTDALRYAERAVALDPQLAHAHFALGSALHASARSAEAVAPLEEALRLMPGLAIACQSLGNVRQALGQLQAAVVCQQQALALAPGLVSARINLSALFCALGDSAAAIREARRALELDPASFHAWSNLLYALVHDESASADEINAAHRDFGRQVEARVGLPAGGWRVSFDPGRPLRLGFVSGDLRDHPVAHFLRPVWRELDRRHFRIVAFSTSPLEDAVTAGLRADCDEWHDVSRCPELELDVRVRECRVDILFDLSGHTAGNRLAVFARKPAPLQVTWLGYPGSTGLAAMDFRLVDATQAPPGRFDAGFSERLLYLPYANVFDPPAGLPAVAPLPCLDRRYLTFGSFNRPNKLSDGTLALWGAVLRALPDSRLLVGAVSDQTVEERLRRRLGEEGVDAGRLSFSGRLSLPDYLSLHREVDLALDTQPFSSGTTANFALWMGVPTLTLSGERFVQRLCASRMAAAGLEGFIATTPDEFVALACHWAGVPGELAALRSGLRAHMLAQAERQPAELVRALEALLRQAWRQLCHDREGAGT
ncbi:tetratricopeptide repeat protein [Zoogloea sp.]|uniref:O-linked N-acetylglucosamine transferase, SPINDLY family protein n=1 Tax=Zoogloea sp. TaxID=49181 RepID=UPI0014157BD0|nr:MAG: tetratricopeptide repeat protein [Zoogloea sp.]